MRARRTAFLAGITTLLLVGMGGCAAFNHQNDSLIRIKSSRNTAKAQRFTVAGVNALENGKLEYAKEKLLSAIRADPQYGPAHNNLGLLQFDQGKLYQSVLSFERAKELMPADPAVYYNLGLVLEQAGRTSQALDLYWQAVELDPTEPHFLGNLVRLRRRLGENGPDVVAQLQDLMLIETRPDWRDWAAEQLEVTLNPHLDRGPENPEFGVSETGADQGNNKGQQQSQTRIIDLSPDAGKQKSGDESEAEPELLPPGRLENLTPELHLSDTHSRTTQESDAPTSSSSKVIPIRSEGAFNTLPQSISESQRSSAASKANDDVPPASKNSSAQHRTGK